MECHRPIDNQSTVKSKISLITSIASAKGGGGRGGGEGRGGGTPLYPLYRYVQRAWFLSCFGLKTGIDFDHYGLKSGMVFKGNHDSV